MSMKCSGVAQLMAKANDFDAPRAPEIELTEAAEVSRNISEMQSLVRTNGHSDGLQTILQDLAS